MTYASKHALQSIVDNFRVPPEGRLCLYVDSGQGCMFVRYFLKVQNLISGLPGEVGASCQFSLEAHWNGPEVFERHAVDLIHKTIVDLHIHEANEWTLYKDEFIVNPHPERLDHKPIFPPGRREIDPDIEAKLLSYGQQIYANPMRHFKLTDFTEA